MMNAKDLAEIAASAVPPHEREKRNLDVTLPARDGWQVCIFYDRGEFGYLDHFVSPDGEVIVPWSMLDGDERACLRYWSPPLPLASMSVKRSN
ncbi:hypothetical protein [Bosea sp. BK604]|uniref:hypothetical protein n=1 Tax=Bosea sp. BK604 TaxID=2512180 RepID=UPI0010508330|nr:hypothetical protein [Bosea sp. BK604]